MKYPGWESTQLQTKVTDFQTVWVHLNSKLPEPSCPGERQGETPTKHEFRVQGLRKAAGNKPPRVGITENDQ